MVRGCGKILILLMAVTTVTMGCGVEGAEVIEASGDTIELGQITVTVEGREFRDQVEPDEPIGYYNLYEEHEGYQYYVIAGTAQNHSGGSISSGGFIVTGETGGKRENGKLVFMDESRSEFVDEIEAEESLPCLIFVLTGEEEEPESVNIFFNGNYRAGDGGQFDYEVRYS